ncbi:MAG TPA: coproporphyrinogen dehydrogenase HemZ [Firmicutes bacterium]|jgi:oxygen-independent coproporphyrinogen III oxidase|nr:coproporphyrinogen dehydrogenase HemZ [Bacillota bacterium]
MKFFVEIQDARQLANVIAALKIIDPQAEVTEEHYDLRLIVEYSSNFWVRIWAPDLPEDENLWEMQDQDIFDPRYQESDYPKRLKELIRLGIISLLGKRFDRKPIWGTLSAVRPTKIFHHLRQRGFSVAETRQKLLTIYALTPEITDLLIEIGTRQEKFFQPARTVSLYIGIPFCPSRCRYCSFAAVSLETHHHLVKGFLEALHLEIAATRQLIREHGFQVESVYIGGGTPTSLNLADFAELLQAVQGSLVSEHTREFTVEAGRPETIDADKIQAMKNAGVTRVCVNPQTMKDETLQLIGRRHSVAQFIQAVMMVEQMSHFIVNMDLILGLPGENGADFLQSCQQVLQLKPENITIHTLAPKRAAAWHKDFAALDLTQEQDIGKAWNEALSMLRRENYFPYYIYRQRSILAEQANIGLARPETENIYNIQMMEERETILGLGGGAITKWVFGSDYQVLRLQNPKCPATYHRDIGKLIVKKAQQTRLLLG